MSRAGTSRAERGYTLVELLVVLGVGTLIVSALPAAFGTAFPSVALDASANDLAAALITARAEAIRGRKPVVVTFSGDGMKRGGEEVAVLFEAGDGQSLTYEAVPETVTPQQSELTFFEDGTASGGTIVLSDGDLKAQIAINWLTGSVRVEQ